MRISDWSSDVCSSDLDRSGDILAQNLVRHADHRRLLHRRMEMERGLDLERRDVVAAADDQFLRPPGHDQIAILVDEAEVAGLGPAALAALRRCFGLVAVLARMFMPAIDLADEAGSGDAMAVLVAGLHRASKESRRGGWGRSDEVGVDRSG